MKNLTELKPTPAQALRGWVTRSGEYYPDPKPSSAPILVRGTRKEDDPFDYKHGFVYAETPEEAEAYDIKWGYNEHPIAKFYRNNIECGD